MKIQFSQSIDFNQMLVFSVFGHLLLLTAVLFLPKPRLPEKAIVPAFMVNLVSEPTGFKSAAKKSSKPPAKTKKPELKRAAEKIPATKKITVPKPSKQPGIQTPKSKGILEELSELETKMVVSPQKNMVEELDQLARLEKPEHKPLVTKPVKSVTEETFRELETLKNKKVHEVKAVAPVLLHEDILNNFDELKLEESLLETTPKAVSIESTQKPVPEKKDSEKPKSSEVDLLKELQQLARLDATPVAKVETRKPESHEKTPKDSKPFDSIAEKFSSLSVESEPVRVEISSARLESSRFQSKLRTLPKTSKSPMESGTGDSYVFAKKEGIPGADVQSLYVGMIQDKIYKNWREPLAEEHNQETVVSFFIFPHGNIDKPFVKKSSGVEALDTLAVRAVLDSVPFPEFPVELKMSNLHINIYFKYVPKDK
ncbi:MAG: TonB C-terminal domain-containing protein [Nitrospinae bacterium]|nr:TonB C-terminal domain-containing protein [Nitrospinota bacterium]MBL7020286.1 TonB C-terminal domain-containing protein [Nitrospinaceae bacterium]